MYFYELLLVNMDKVKVPSIKYSINSKVKTQCYVGAFSKITRRLSIIEANFNYFNGHCDIRARVADSPE